MRSRFCPLFVAALFSSTACAIPNRDNRFDPDSAPGAHLKIEDLGTGAACAAVDSNGAFALVASVPHGHCLLLDARDSTDPLGDGSALRFEFASIDSSGHATTIEASSPTAVAVVSSALLRSFPIDVPAVFRVTVSHGSRKGIAEANVVPLNTAPVAIGDPPRTFPLGGFPWSLGTPYTIGFDAFRSSDPDGDAIAQYCWTLPGATEQCSPLSSATFQADPTVGGAFSARLRVIDSLGASSSLAAAKYAIGVPAIWGGSATAGGFIDSLSRIDETWRQIPNLPDYWTLDLIQSADPAAGRVLLYDKNQIELDLVSMQSPSTRLSVGNISLAAVPEGVHYDSAAGRIWVVSGVYTMGGSPPMRDLSAWKIQGGDFLVPEAPSFTVPAGAGDANASLPPTTPVFLSTDTAGDVYYVRFGSTPVSAVTSTGVLLSSWDSSPGDAFYGLAQRPGTAEVWGVEGESLFGSATGAAAIVRFDPNGVATRFPVGETTAYEIGWIDANRFWTRIGVEACLVDATRLVPGAAVDSAIDVRVAVGPHVVLRVDPISGDAWWQTIALNDLLIAHADGTSETSSTNFFPQHADDNGNIWSIYGTTQNSGAGSVSRSAGIDPDAVLLRFPVGGSSTRDFTGGVWTSSIFPRALEHLAQDGTVLERITRLQGPAGSQSVPLVVEMDVDSTGNLWGIAAVATSGTPTFAVVHIDLSQRPAPDEAVLVSTTLLTSFPGPAFAIKSGSPRAWVELLTFSPPYDLSIFDDNGAPGAPRFSIPGTELLGSLEAVSPSTGALCLFTFDAANFRLRYIPVSGTIRNTATFAAPSGSAVLGAASARIGSGDACWISWSDATTMPATIHLRAYNPTGSILRDYSDTGAAVRGIFPGDAEHVWLLRAVNATDSVTELVEFNANGTLRDVADAPPAALDSFLP